MNLCQLIVQSAEHYPENIALSVPLPGGEYVHLSYRDFISLAGYFQRQLTQQGFHAGDRLVVLIPPGRYLYPLLVAILGLGMVAVMPERGLPRAQFRAALRHCRPKGLITIASVGKFWPLIPELWRIKRLVIDRPVPGMKRLKHCLNLSAETFVCRSLAPSTTGLITFTSGTTGIPKGANRTHNSLLEQHLAIETNFPSAEHDVDLHSFPVLVLQTLSTGRRSILPHFDFARPGAVNPPSVIQQIHQFGVTRISGAPAYVQKIIRYAQAQRLVFPAVRQVVIGGAPGNIALYQGCLKVFPQAQQHVIYGSTEAEPIACVEMRTLTKRWSQQEGYLVGKPIDVAEIYLRDLTASGVPGALKAPLPGEVGEILVAGPHVLFEYFNNPQATRQHKLPRKEGGIWHCTGDVGYFDESGYIWLLGRVNDGVNIRQRQVVYPYTVEKRLNDIEGIERSALVAHPQGGAALILQYSVASQEVAIILEALQLTDDVNIYQIAEMPVDIRHNSKINRLKLNGLLKKNALKRCNLD